MLTNGVVSWGGWVGHRGRGGDIFYWCCNRCSVWLVVVVTVVVLLLLQSCVFKKPRTCQKQLVTEMFFGVRETDRKGVRVRERETVQLTDINICIYNLYISYRLVTIIYSLYTILKISGLVIIIIYNIIPIHNPINLMFCQTFIIFLALFDRTNQ